MLNNDILIEIFNLLDVKSQINMVSLSHFFKNKIFITDLYNHDKNILKKLTTKILKQKIFKNVVIINAYNNVLITDISFMKKIKILNAEGRCGIDQNCINNLNLIELNASCNEKIKNVEKKCRHFF